MNKAAVGVQNLNKQLQAALNPAPPGAKEVQRYGTTFRVGDKVIQTQNNYTREVFNGDIGRIVAIEPLDQVAVVEFDGRPVEYDFGDLDELHLAYAISIHKCVAGYGRASVQGRGLIPVREVAVGDQIQTGRGDHRAVLDRIPTGVKPVVRVRTRCGYTIDVSEEHPLLVSTEDRGPHFRRAGELIPGVFACIDRSVVPGSAVRLPEVAYDATQKPQKRVHPPGELTEELAWALGVIVGDGCYRDQRDGMIDVTNQDEGLHAAFRRAFEPMGLVVTTRPVGNHFRTYFCSVPLRRWLSRLGLGHHLAHEKATPDVVFGADVPCRAAYLRGLFDADGSVGRINVRFTTASSRMAAEVQELLLALGVVSVRSSQGERHHKVSVSGTGVPVFRERIGFTVPGKKQMLDELAARNGRGTGKTNYDVIPHGRELIRSVRELVPLARGVRGRGLYANGDRSSTFMSGLLRGVYRTNYTHLRKAAARLKADGLPVPAPVETALRENFFYDPIASVERLAVGAEMYDLEVDDKHSFVVNGFVCHNSQGSEYPAVVIPLHTTHYIMLQRNLLYTGITRGKRLVVLVGSRKALGIAVRKADTARRFSLLKWRLRHDEPSPPSH
jgi:intein/homing endonuclease